MLKKAGLPTHLRLRHDFHFVEELTKKGPALAARMLQIDRIDPNPKQPRYEIGDISELTMSIKEKGIIEPLVVRNVDGRYQLISGERRYRAAIEAGLTEVPCVEREADDREALELALVENLQRKDLTPFEEADGFRTLCDQFGHTHADVARSIGKARNSVTETIRLSDIPEHIRELCRRADITARSALLQIAKCSSQEEMVALIRRTARQRLTRDGIRELRKGPERQKCFIYHFKTDDGKFSCQIRYRKGSATKEEVIARLRELLVSLESGGIEFPTRQGDLFGETEDE